MADAPTQRDLFLAARRELVLQPTLFNRAIIDTPGSDVNVIVNAAATMGEEVVRYFLVALNELGLATSEGEALDRWVYDHYQMTRNEAASAVVPLVFNRSNTNGFTILAGSQFGTEDGVVFTTINDVAFPAGVLGPITVNAVATETGTGGNVAAGTIVQVLTAQEDSTLTVTNDENAAGGTDRETDEALRDRAREFFVTARRGTREAIQFGALQTQGVAQANAEELFQVTDDGAIPGYRVHLYVADGNGQANTALASSVELALDEYRALGVPVLVIPSIPQYEDIVVKGLAFTAGVNTSDVLQNAANALLAYVNALRPGETMRQSALLGVLYGVDGLIVPKGAMLEPLGDVVPTAGTVIRTTRDRIQLSA